MPHRFNSGIREAGSYFISWLGPRHGLIVVKEEALLAVAGSASVSSYDQPVV